MNQIYRKARAAAIKLVREQWGEDSIQSTKLNMVTAWDAQGLSRWDITLDTEYVANPVTSVVWVEVNHVDFVAQVLDQTPQVENKEVEFKFMNSKIEVVRWYSVINADAIAGFKPISVKLTFMDEDLLYVQVYGRKILGLDLVDKAVSEIPGIYEAGRQHNWPEWLKKFCARASVHGLAGV